MTLKSIVCGMKHHAYRTRAHCPTIVLILQFSSAVRLFRSCRFYQCSNACGRSPQILNFSLYIRVSPALRLNQGKQTVNSGLVCVRHKATNGTLSAVRPQLDIFLTSGHRRE